ncbi:MAG: AEC family transporter [Gammaproteobacteria bacterium]|nr:MAG: AEC family transporter [Gammaproteobacteria bacterium]
MWHVLGIIFPVFAVVAVGFLYARRHGPDMDSANRINLEVFTPALIFSVLADRDFDLSAHLPLLLGGILVVLGSGLLAWPVARLFGWRARTFVPPMMFNNSGNMGLPLAVFAFGESALGPALVLFLVENTLHFTLGNAMLIHRVDPRALLRLPMLRATLAGILFSLAGWDLPRPLAEAISLLGQVAIPLMLFSLGVRMIGVRLEDWRIGLAGALVCPLAGLLAAWPVTRWLPIEGGEAAQLIVFAALPPAVLNFMLAERYGVEPRRVASIVLLGNLASLVVLPLVLYAVL